MACYTFDGQHFHPCEPRVPWPDGMSFEDWMLASGFGSPGWTYGDEMSGITIYHNEDETAFFADVCPFGGSCHSVYIDSFPALMVFIRDHAHPAVLASMAQEVRQLDALSRKAFRAWHGHDAFNFCGVCDPSAHRQRMRRQSKA